MREVVIPIRSMAKRGWCLPCVCFIDVNHITEPKWRDAGIEQPLLEHIIVVTVKLQMFLTHVHSVNMPNRQTNLTQGCARVTASSNKWSLPVQQTLLPCGGHRVKDRGAGASVLHDTYNVYCTKDHGNKINHIKLALQKHSICWH